MEDGLCFNMVCVMTEVGENTHRIWPVFQHGLCYDWSWGEHRWKMVCVSTWSVLWLELGRTHIEDGLCFNMVCVMTGVGENTHRRWSVFQHGLCYDRSWGEHRWKMVCVSTWSVLWLELGRTHIEDGLCVNMVCVMTGVGENTHRRWSVFQHGLCYDWSWGEHRWEMVCVSTWSVLWLKLGRTHIEDGLCVNMVCVMTGVGENTHRRWSVFQHGLCYDWSWGEHRWEMVCVSTWSVLWLKLGRTHIEYGLCFNMVCVMTGVEVNTDGRWSVFQHGLCYDWSWGEHTQKMVCVSTWSVLWLELARTQMEDGLCFNMVCVMTGVGENTHWRWSVFQHGLCYDRSWGEHRWKMVCVSTWSVLWLELARTHIEDGLCFNMVCVMTGVEVNTDGRWSVFQHGLCYDWSWGEHRWKMVCVSTWSVLWLELGRTHIEDGLCFNMVCVMTGVEVNTDGRWSVFQHSLCYDWSWGEHT